MAAHRFVAVVGARVLPESAAPDATFPVLVEVHHEPAAKAEQPKPEKDSEHEIDAQEMIERAEETNGRMVASHCRRRRWLPRWLSAVPLSEQP